ncbi:UbiA family prenyltransferase [Azospirillum sp.]|uniref:UbiA family prenyltransferase n=1 Tax=Azospirillum sp. TaxID=34012 RepID=UPI002D3ED16D|nr:UbiA family prenyltransferase [Azospirillum sp.]HYD65141.1 UbiA family prenyltransferase [Azospirillum sp.]
MGAATAVLIRPRAALVLGRVSNLPTVLSNALAGIALTGIGLAGAAWPPAVLIGAAAALALLYVGGMYLNDAFDAEVDARERPARPIPRGDAARGAVFAAGFALVGAGVALAAVPGPAALLCGALLAGAILLYDAVHKHTAAAPAIMGLCRLLAYLTAAAMAGGDALGTALLLGGGGLFCHVVGLTYAAKQEAYDRLDNAWPLAVLAVPLAGALWAAMAAAGAAPLALVLWAALAATTAWAVRRLFRRAPGDVPRAVAALIAAIALYDAVLIAAAGQPLPALIAALCFPLTLALQRIVPGT